MVETAIPAQYLAAQVRGHLANWAHLPASRQLRALLCWGLGQTPAIPASKLREALRGASPDIDRQLGPELWRTHVRDARQLVARPGSPAARGAIAASVTDGLLGRVCSDRPANRSSAHSSARRVATLAAVEVLRDLGPGGRGFDTVLTTADDVAVAMSMSRRAVVDAQALSVENRWLGKVRAHRGRPTRWRPVKTARGGERDVRRRLAAGGDLEEAAAAVARLDTDHLLVAVLTSVDHPGWAVDWLGVRAWTVALAHAMNHADGPARFGLSRPTVRAARTDLLRLGLGPVQHWPAEQGRALLAALDRAADEPGADGRTAREARDAALEARRAQIQERAAARQAFAEAQAATRTRKPTVAMGHLEAEPAKVPTTADRPAAAGQWVRLPEGYDDAAHREALDRKLAATGRRAVQIRAEGDRMLARVEPLAAVSA